MAKHHGFSAPTGLPGNLEAQATLLLYLRGQLHLELAEKAWGCAHIIGIAAMLNVRVLDSRRLMFQEQMKNSCAVKQYRAQPDSLYGALEDIACASVKMKTELWWLQVVAVTQNLTHLPWKAETQERLCLLHMTGPQAGLTNFIVTHRMSPYAWGWGRGMQNSMFDLIWSFLSVLWFYSFLKPLYSGWIGVLFIHLCIYLFIQELPGKSLLLVSAKTTF